MLTDSGTKWRSWIRTIPSIQVFREDSNAPLERLSFTFNEAIIQGYGTRAFDNDDCEFVIVAGPLNTEVTLLVGLAVNRTEEMGQFQLKCVVSTPEFQEFDSMIT